MSERAATRSRAPRPAPARARQPRTPKRGELVDGGAGTANPGAPSATASRPLPPAREPLVVEGGTAQSGAEFGPGSRLRALVAVEGARSDFYVGFMANGTTFLLFQAAAAIGARRLGCRTGRGTDEETAWRAELALPDGEHEYALGWGPREVVWSLDGKVVTRHRATYAGPSHKVVVRAAGGTRAVVRDLAVDGVAVSVQRA